MVITISSESRHHESHHYYILLSLKLDFYVFVTCLVLSNVLDNGKPHASLQAIAVVSFAAWASLSTLVILRVIDTIMPLRAGHCTS